MACPWSSLNIPLNYTSTAYGVAPPTPDITNSQSIGSTGTESLSDFEVDNLSPVPMLLHALLPSQHSQDFNGVAKQHVYHPHYVAQPPRESPIARQGASKDEQSFESLYPNDNMAVQSVNHHSFSNLCHPTFGDGFDEQQENWSSSLCDHAIDTGTRIGSGNNLNLNTAVSNTRPTIPTSIRDLTESQLADLTHRFGHLPPDKRTTHSNTSAGDAVLETQTQEDSITNNSGYDAEITPFVDNDEVLVFEKENHRALCRRCTGGLDSHAFVFDKCKCVICELCHAHIKRSDTGCAEHDPHFDHPATRRVHNVGCALCSETAFLISPGHRSKPLVALECGHVFHGPCIEHCFRAKLEPIVLQPRATVELRCPSCEAMHAKVKLGSIEAGVRKLYERSLYYGWDLAIWARSIGLLLNPQWNRWVWNC